MMLDTFRKVLASGDFQIPESFELPARDARFGEIPEVFRRTQVRQWLGSVDSGRLWLHQAKALELLGRGSNVVISTGTASGKSLIFRAMALHRILEEPDAKVAVFYPLKALIADQLRGWAAACSSLGLPENSVGRIDGSVPMGERELILDESRIIVMTPDVCHAWMMSNLAKPVVRSFIRCLRLVVLDEAHVLEGVFGSNFAFLMRRIVTARTVLKKESPRVPPLQFIATTATISNPSEHLKLLTGFKFQEVGAEDDGSPQHDRYCCHVAVPPDLELEATRDIQLALAKSDGRDAFITFVDSRKGVEVLARASNETLDDLLINGKVLPYRAGFDSDDRESIERRLRSGYLKGVVSTSALELGIDLPNLAIGLNLGVPASRKSYRQRLGRVARTAPGAFAIIGNPFLFSGFGTSFRSYHDTSVEPSYLYLQNRFMQFAHARCLSDELDALGEGVSLPTGARWPDGFERTYDAAKPGGHRPTEFDAIAQIGGDTPQRNYPLRNIGELSFKFSQNEAMGTFGDINESQALREAYPGATYLHLGRAWEVQSWLTRGFPPAIKVKAGNPRRSTRPKIKTWVNASILAQDLLDGHLRKSEKGFIAECEMQVTEKVEGFVENPGDHIRFYSDLRQKNPNMKSRLRNFRTTGVLLSIDEPWFRQAAIKSWLSDRLSEMACREFSIISQDIASVSTNITVRSQETSGLQGDCIAVYDQTYGSLRLTEAIYHRIGELVQRCAHAIQGTEDASKDNYLTTLRLLSDELGKMDDSAVSSLEPEPLENGLIQCFASGSKVCFRESGKVAIEVEIIQPTLMDGQLMYQVRAAPRFPGQPPVKNWVSARFLEPSAEGGAWEYGWWNTETQAFENPATEE